MVGKALRIAVKAHRGQREGNGLPYVWHPIRIMLQMRTDDERIVALLHDVVEHADWTFNDLRKKGFRGKIVRAVEHLTKRPGEAYDAYIKRLGPHRLARAVKIGDLRDNLAQCLGPKPTADDRRRIAKYRAALRTLGAKRVRKAKRWIKE
jgi:GTP diphosphokinase / guanosine-3',5'-bis(diphosphate) 3'-diphosphatase